MRRAYVGMGFLQNSQSTKGLGFIFGLLSSFRGTLIHIAVSRVIVLEYPCTAVLVLVQLLYSYLGSWAEQNWGRCQSSCSAGSSKIKIRTSSRHKAQLALLVCLDEVRILIFDCMTENEDCEQGQQQQHQQPTAKSIASSAVSTTRLGGRERELRVANPASNPATASYPSASPVLSNPET
jgi:hypothetical protein